MTRQQGKASATLIFLDAIGFVLIIAGGTMTRYFRSEAASILGGIVAAIGIAILALARVMTNA